MAERDATVTVGRERDCNVTFARNQPPMRAALDRSDDEEHHGGLKPPLAAI